MLQSKHKKICKKVLCYHILILFLLFISNKSILPYYIYKKGLSREINMITDGLKVEIVY